MPRLGEARAGGSHGAPPLGHNEEARSRLLRGWINGESEPGGLGSALPPYSAASYFCGLGSYDLWWVGWGLFGWVGLVGNCSAVCPKDSYYQLRPDPSVGAFCSAVTYTAHPRQSPVAAGVCRYTLAAGLLPTYPLSRSSKPTADGDLGFLNP